MNKWQYLPRDLCEKHWERARIYTRPKTGTGITSITSPSADFGRLRKTSDFFGMLRNSLGIFGNDCVVYKNPSTPRIKISRLYLRKSWQVYKIEQRYARSPKVFYPLDFHARSRFAHSTITEEKWGTTRSLFILRIVWHKVLLKKKKIGLFSKLFWVWYCVL